jgi:hypothetical protein
MTPADVLRAVPTHLDKHGWVQREWLNSRGACCASEAVNQITKGANPDLKFDTRYHFAKLFGTSMVGYNDTTGRTLEEVKTACLQAADAWEATQ